jgi:aerobic carbon-monoxide dehydrogenase medium subunit
MSPNDVLIPSSPEEAVESFGDGRGITVVAGGTIVMPSLKAGLLRPERALLLTRAGLEGIRKDGRTLTIGAMTPVLALVGEAPEPLSTFASYVGDYEVRAQATVGGNLCAPPGPESPRGDLQAALLALGARVRSAGAGGERSEPIDDFLADGEGRLVLEIEVDEPKRASAARLERPHAHAYTILAVAAAEGAEGTRVAVSGAGPRAQRLPSVEQALAEGADPKTAAARVSDDASPVDDALASAWYRTEMLPVVVERALRGLGA